MSKLPIRIWSLGIKKSLFPVCNSGLFGGPVGIVGIAENEARERCVATLSDGRVVKLSLVRGALAERGMQARMVSADPPSC